MSEFQNIARKLPSDPGYALLVFADESWKIYVKTQGQISDDDGVFISRFIESFIKRFGLKCSLQIPKTGKASEIAVSVLEQVRNQRTSLAANMVDASINDIIDGYSTSQEGAFGLARLNDDEKVKILQHLENVRVIIASSAVADRKKNALYEKLSDLQREVNTHGTRTDRFFAFAGDIGFVLGDMAQNAKPLLNEVKDILKIVSRSRARQEGISLPPGDEVLKLAAPEDIE